MEVDRTPRYAPALYFLVNDFLFTDVDKLNYKHEFLFYTVGRYEVKLVL